MASIDKPLDYKPADAAVVTRPGDVFALVMAILSFPTPAYLAGLIFGVVPTINLAFARSGTFELFIALVFALPGASCLITAIVHRRRKRVPAVFAVARAFNLATGVALALLVLSMLTARPN